MKFLHPGFLYALAFLAIPVIIHLFNFRKAVKVYFSNTRFLKNVKESTKTKRRLKHYLILASRMLFLFFLVMAFAQPYIPSGIEDPEAENVYIYLDNSMSMSNAVSNEGRALDLGLSFIDQITRLYPGNTNFKLLTNAFDPSSQTFKTRDQIQELVTEIELSHVSRTMAEAYSRLQSDFNQSGPGKDVYIISDFQKSTLGELTDWQPDSTANHFLVPISFYNTHNVFIDSVYLASPFLMAEEQNILNVTLRNTGEEDVEDLMIKLFANEVQTATSSVTIPASGTAETSFRLSFTLQSVNLCRLSFEDFPVTFDNDFYFILRLEDKVNILEIKESDQVSPVQKVYANSRLFNFNSQHVRNLNYSLIEQSDLVVLHALSAIDPSLATILQNYTRAGGDLIIIPAPGFDPAALSIFINAGITVLPDAPDVAIAMPDVSNPFFYDVFERTDENFEMPKVRSLFSWNQDRFTLLQLRNGVRYLSTFGERENIYLFGSPLEDLFTNLHRHALFVPVMYRIASFSKESNSGMYASINEPVVEVKIDSIAPQQIYKLRNDEGEWIPAQRINGNQLVMEMPKFSIQPGFYELMQEGRKIDALAFNTDKKESRLPQFSFDDLRQAFSQFENVKVFDVSAENEFNREMQAYRKGVPLWKLAIFLSLLFLLTESLIIRFMK